MHQLGRCIAHMFNNVVADDRVELLILKRKLYTLHAVIGVAVAYLTVVVYIHRRHAALQAGVRCEVVRYAARAAANFQQAYRLGQLL